MQRRLVVFASLVTWLGGSAAADLASDVKKKRDEVGRAHAELLRCIQEDRDSGDRRAFDEMQRGLEWIKSKAPSGDANRAWAEKLLADFLRLRDPFDQHLTLHVQAAAAMKAHDDWRKEVAGDEKRLAAELAALADDAELKAKLERHRQQAKDLGDKIKTGSPAARDLDKLKSLRGRAAGYSGALEETRAIASRLKENADRTLAAVDRAVDETEKELASLGKGADHPAWRDGYAKLAARAEKDAKDDKLDKDAKNDKNAKGASLDAAKLETELVSRVGGWAEGWKSGRVPERSALEAMQKQLSAARTQLKADRINEPASLAKLVADLEKLERALEQTNHFHQSTEALLSKIEETGSDWRAEGKRVTAKLTGADTVEKLKQAAHEVKLEEEKAAAAWRALDAAVDRWKSEGAAIEGVAGTGPARQAFAARDAYLMAELRRVQAALKKAVNR